MLPTLVLCLTLLGQNPLPGSNMSLQQAKEDATTIVAAKLVDAGAFITEGASATLVLHVELDPTAVLKGKAGKSDLKSVGASLQANEKWPPKGEEYLFFIIEYKMKGNFQIIKMLPRTKENLKEASGT